MRHSSAAVRMPSSSECFGRCTTVLRCCELPRWSQPKRINKSLREVTAIWRAIQNGDPDVAEQCCVDHVKAAAVAALSMIERSSASKEKRLGINRGPRPDQDPLKADREL